MRKTAFTIVASLAVVGSGLFAFSAAHTGVLRSGMTPTIWQQIQGYGFAAVFPLYFALSIVACRCWHRSRLVRLCSIVMHAIPSAILVYAFFRLGLEGEVGVGFFLVVPYALFLWFFFACVREKPIMEISCEFSP